MPFPHHRQRLLLQKQTGDEARRFELLRKAYVDARYKKSYAITREELEWLSRMVETLWQVVEKSLRGKMADFADEVSDE